MEIKKIAIIDNDKLSVEALANVLTKDEYKIYKAYDGVEGLDIIRAQRPQAILLDLFMPGIDGGRLCRYLKTQEDTRDIKVIILSPLTLNETVTFMDVYPDAYIAKGFIMEVADNARRILKLLSDPIEFDVSQEELALGFEGRSPRVVVEELLLERKHYETVMHNVGDGILEVNANDIVIYANPAAMKIIKKSEQDIVGNNIVDVLGKRYDGEFQTVLVRLKHAHTLINEAMPMIYAGKTLEVNFANIITETKEHSGFLLILQDVTFLTDKIRELTLLNDVGRLLTSTLDFNEVLNILMSQIQKIMRVEATSLLLVEKETKDLIFEVALGAAAHTIKNKRIPAGHGVVGWVAETGKPVLIPDVSVDTRFDKSLDEEIGFTTKSMICVPLKIRNEVIGVIQILNHENGRPFNEDNVYLLSSISMYASIAIEHATLYRQFRLQKK